MLYIFTYSLLQYLFKNIIYSIYEHVYFHCLKKKVIFDKLFIYSSTNRFMLSYSYSCIVYVLLLSVKKELNNNNNLKKIYFDVEMEVHYINSSFTGTTKNKCRKYKNRFIERKCFKQIK